jgi:glycosyltransferase involved in cell wall biosynthesis
MLLFHHLVGTWETCVDKYIALTEFSRRKFIDGGLPAEKIALKPNFLYPDPGHRSHDAGYALFVGRLSEEKGFSTLVRAWENLPDIPLKVAGDGPLMSAAVNKAASRVTGAGIEVLGWLPRQDILKLLSEASYLVVPSVWYEGFPLTIIEAFACGVPVIGSRLGGIGEVIQHQQSGLLFDPGNSADLVTAARRLWEDTSLRLRLGEGARSQYETLYTAERNYRILMEIFEDVAR